MAASCVYVVSVLLDDAGLCIGLCDQAHKPENICLPTNRLYCLSANAKYGITDKFKILKNRVGNTKTMYSLFQISKILSVCKPGGDKGVKILLSAYSANDSNSILALVCDNGYVVFRHISTNLKAPVVRQLCWFNNKEKEIKTLCFDSSGTWLLTITQDATLYIIPTFSVTKVENKSGHWKTDNVTEIKLSGQRALTTSIQWWQTHEHEHIAIIGSELGEISFINLVNKKEVGGTYITSGISALDILYDESHDTTYLLITGSNQQQWRLLLEEKKSNFYWPFSSESELASPNTGKGLPALEKMALTDEKNGDQRPHRLSKFESGTFLTPQCGGGRNLVSAYNSSSCLLQVLEGDLDQMHLFSYKVPPDCENIILSDKLIFVTSRNPGSSQCILKIISRKFAEISSENSKKKEVPNSEIQKFMFNEEILAIYKLVVQHQKSISDQLSLNADSDSSSKKNSHGQSKNNPANVLTKNIMASLNALYSERQNIEGCILVQRDCVWECRLRIPAEVLFLSLTATPSDLPLAEKLGVMLGLDLHKLYDVAADAQLSWGQFAQAVHLYQLSKCPQLKRVAHFMGYGFLSELIAYIQVLFTTKGVEIVAADKCHFANIALHCFAHQVKNKLQEKNAIDLTFRKFLKENAYYDEEVASKLLSEQGLYELLNYFAKVRGQQGLMVETLFSTDGISNTVDDQVYNALLNSGYEVMLHHSNNEHYMACMTSYQLLQFLVAKPSLLNQHLQHCITLLPKMDTDLLQRVAFLYDPSHQVLKLYFRNLASEINNRYWSLSSLNTISSERFDSKHKEDIATNEDIIKFFIFVLLMLCHKLGAPKFSKDLIENTKRKNGKTPNVDQGLFSMSNNELSMFDYSPISCGQAHVGYIHNSVLYTWGKSGNGRLGTEDMGMEYQSPLPVITFLQLRVNVLAVSCGSAHTLALTDFGIFGWGSSRYGQLGIAEVQQTNQPRLIESISREDIAKVQCGQYHSLALTSDGRVFSWGWGIHGQLGHGNAEDLMFPKVINCLKKKKIISICAGQGHTVILSKNGDVYTFGCGMFGQLGTGSTVKQSSPQTVKIAERIKLIASGHFHVIAISRNNQIYSWGCNPQALRLQAQNSRRARHHGSSSSSSNHGSNSAFGNSAPHRHTHTPVAAQLSHLLPNVINSVDEAIIEISCGSHHSALVTASGNLYTWGRNSEGQIGNGTRKEQKIPSLVTSPKDKKITHVACGADFTVALDTNGKLFGWGQNDGGQIGQKPTLEANSKYNSGSSSGRVITIRTNRRMITITQPCRQSILRPVEINLTLYDVKNPAKILDSGSYESEYSVMTFVHNKYQNRSDIHESPYLSSLDPLSYGPASLHAALETFHLLCDSSTILNHCLNFGNFQAAAKLCALENMYDKALEYQLQALISISTDEIVDLKMALYVISYYASSLDHESVDSNGSFLNQVIQFWMKNKLPVSPLESFFLSYLHIFASCLSLLILKSDDPGLDPETNQFLNLLSPNFCLTMTSEVLKEIERGRHRHILEETGIMSDLNKIQKSDALTSWDDSIPQDRLWMDILHNLQTSVMSHSSILLTSNDVDVLSKSLASEKFYAQSFNSSSRMNANGYDAVLFSCGHHFTYPNFQTNVLPQFMESTHSLLNSKPHTIKLLLSEYDENVITAACPKCVVAEISNEL
ncbi:hypothetical protein JTE90_013556 [Oedothorax gibbosus]|uniref:Uncharacterized protein n=1 Tax=Oedothorax gibbosus TaxID=931172 RepID=A0AAV6UBN7_9ARAC|nr:hypothetical protein JTE90_013556 [Oedothorax gibbosus]